SVASFLDRERCLQAADGALALCGEQIDPEIRSNALGQVAYWNLLFRRWDERDLLASIEALASTRRRNDLHALALHANRHAYFLALPRVIATPARRPRRACTSQWRSTAWWITRSASTSKHGQCYIWASGAGCVRCSAPQSSGLTATSNTFGRSSAVCSTPFC